MGRVQDQVAVVTGAAKGLGKSIALRLAEDGARVVLGDIDGPGLAATATAVREAGGEAVTVVGDITEEEPAAQLIESAIEHGGRSEADATHFIEKTMMKEQKRYLRDVY